ncbi:hypothetical protein M422DRAFT_50384 [Sphaerobolus stellatus SS14]|uniref:Uncharacterized protein n=1 Tax=Sphaerobolus stellatus (strain SS14) TaxID=990650 RepID=A0A0C9VJK9_SPHS4|nr:hypothetical protein M422DRAFT_50384 [Sphaerobolus stellatus SS14]
MSTWLKHIYHVSFTDGYIEPQCRTMYIVVMGQDSLPVHVPEDFPWYGHSFPLLSPIEDEDVKEFDFALIKRGSELREDFWELLLCTGSPPALRRSFWASLINERDVHIIEWITGQVKYGTWNGRDVILKVAIDHVFMDGNFTLASEFEAYRYTQGLDLTPKFLGYIVRDRFVVGFVLEVLKGRRTVPAEEDFDKTHCITPIRGRRNYAFKEICRQNYTY